MSSNDIDGGGGVLEVLVLVKSSWRGGAGGGSVWLCWHLIGG